jgi:hypothetical protein
MGANAPMNQNTSSPLHYASSPFQNKRVESRQIYDI